MKIKGGLGDVKIKKYLFEVLNSVLKPIRERRENSQKIENKYIKCLKKDVKTQMLLHLKH